MLSGQIRIKWWKKFNTDVVCIRKIQEWLSHDPSSKPASKEQYGPGSQKSNNTA